MGAHFQTEIVLETDQNKVREHFLRLQDDDRYENGHSYSGGFGMASGLAFLTNPSFAEADVESAYEYLSDIVQKWDDALAVRLLNKDGRHVGFVIGALCAS